MGQMQRLLLHRSPFRLVHCCCRCRRQLLQNATINRLLFGFNAARSNMSIEVTRNMHVFRYFPAIGWPQLWAYMMSVRVCIWAALISRSSHRVESSRGPNRNPTTRTPLIASHFWNSIQAATVKSTTKCDWWNSELQSSSRKPDPFRPTIYFLLFATIVKSGVLCAATFYIIIIRLKFWELVSCTRDCAANFLPQMIATLIILPLESIHARW